MKNQAFNLLRNVPTEFALHIAQTHLRDQDVSLKPSAVHNDKVSILVNVNNPIELGKTLWNKFHDTQEPKSTTLTVPFFHFSGGASIHRVWEWFESTFDTNLSTFITSHCEDDEPPLYISLADDIVDQLQALTAKAIEHSQAVRANEYAASNRTSLAKFFNNLTLANDEIDAKPLFDAIESESIFISGIYEKSGLSTSGHEEHDINISIGEFHINVKTDTVQDVDTWVTSIEESTVTSNTANEPLTEIIDTHINDNCEVFLTMALQDGDLQETDKNSLSSSDIHAIELALKNLPLTRTSVQQSK